MTYNPKHYKKCTFQKMGIKGNVGKKKSDKTLTPQERTKIKLKRLREFREWFGEKAER